MAQTLHTRKVLSIIRTYGKKQDSGLHKHRMNQLLIVNEGVFLFEDEKNRQVLFGDKIAFIPAKTKHRTISIGKEVKFHSLYFDSSSSLKSYHSIQFIDGNPLLRELMYTLEKEKKKSETRTLILQLLTRLLETELSVKKTFNLYLPISKDERNKKIIEYIDTNFQKKIKLEDFQNVLPLSTRQIDRIFQLELKISPLEYLKIKRIQMSIVLLKTTNRSIADVAYDCGYDSISSYYSNFEELTGTSPKKFQRGLT